MRSINACIDIWKDDPLVHKHINDQFTYHVNDTRELKEYRDWIEANIFGFGERSFIWMWKLLVDEMPKEFSFLEIGVFRGQILGLIQLLAAREGKLADRTGVTPLDETDGHWKSDYAADIVRLHEEFNLGECIIIKGLSTQPEAIAEAGKKQYDLLYIDGGHTYEVVKSDLQNYLPMVKIGGFLIVDDCANKYNLPDGYFKGIESVSRAVDEVLPNDEFKELFSVVHNRVFKRVK